MQRSWSRWRAVRACVPPVVLLLAASPGVGQQDVPAAREASAPAASSPPEEVAPDPFAVPDGDAAELVAFIEGLTRRQVSSRAEFERLVAALGEAVDKVLAGNPTDAHKVVAVHAKLRALDSLAARGDRKARREMDAFVAALARDPLPAVQRIVRKFGIMQRARNWEGLNGDERTALVDEVIASVRNGPVDIENFQLAMGLGEMIEGSGADDLAARLFAGAAPVFEKCDDRVLATAGAGMAGMARRLTLVGKPMQITGRLLDGSVFDWSAYRGKVVLVDFWATWCGPCRAELPNVKETYKRYHARGFDVVGINLDTEKEEVQDYIKREAIPWPILYHHDAGADGGSHPMAIYYGITGIPTAILVDQEGKVVTLMAVGEELTSQLARLLGEIETPAGEKQDGGKPGGA